MSDAARQTSAASHPVRMLSEDDDSDESDTSALWSESEGGGESDASFYRGKPTGGAGLSSPAPALREQQRRLEQQRAALAPAPPPRRLPPLQSQQQSQQQRPEDGGSRWTPPGKDTAGRAGTPPPAEAYDSEACLYSSDDTDEDETSRGGNRGGVMAAGNQGGVMTASNQGGVMGWLGRAIDSGGGGSGSARGSPVKRPAAASRKEPTAKNILAQVLRLDDVEAGGGGGGGSSDDEDDDDVTPLRNVSYRARAATSTSARGASRAASRVGGGGGSGVKLDLRKLKLSHLGSQSRWSARSGGDEVGSWTARQAAGVMTGRTSAAWLTAAALVQLAGGLMAAVWESGSQWAVPQHDLPIAVFVVVAARATARDALGAGRRSMMMMQLGAVLAMVFGGVIDVVALSKMQETMADPRSPAELGTSRKVGQFGVGTALAGKVLSLPIAAWHAKWVLWPE